MAEAAFPRLAIDHRAGGGELVTHSQIVDEAGNLKVGATARGLAGDHVGKRWRAAKVDSFAPAPALVFAGFRDREVLCGDVQRLVLMRMDHQPVGPLDRRDLDFGQLDGAQMHAGPDPALEEYVVDRIGGAHGDVGVVDGVLRTSDGFDLDAERRGHLPRERLAMTVIRTETTDGLDVAHGARRDELRAGLPARAEDSDARRILARQVFYAKAVGRADADALHDAVGQNRQGLAGCRREQQHQTDITAVRRRPHLAALPRRGDDVGIDTHRPDTQFRNDAVHRFQAVNRIVPPGWDQAVGAA